MRDFEFLKITLEDDDIVDAFYSLFDYLPDIEDIHMVKEKLTENNRLYRAISNLAWEEICNAVTEQMIVVNALELRAKEEAKTQHT